MYKIDTDRIYWREVEGSIIVLDVETALYYELNGTGSMVWKCLLEGRSLRSIVEDISQAFQVDRSVAEKDVAGLLRCLEEEKLIVGK